MAKFVQIASGGMTVALDEYGDPWFLAYPQGSVELQEWRRLPPHPDSAKAREQAALAKNRNETGSVPANME